MLVPRPTWKPNVFIALLCSMDLLLPTQKRCVIILSKTLIVPMYTPVGLSRRRRTRLSAWQASTMTLLISSLPIAL